MATILRVKRRINDVEPSDALIFACKKRKVEGIDDSIDSDALTTVAKFAGTVYNQDNVLEHLTKTFTKDQLQANYKQHVSDVVNKARLQTKKDSKEGRYKVINCFRSLTPIDIEEIDEKGMTVIDVEDSVSCCKPVIDDDVDEYAYDLYYSKTGEDLAPDDQFTICPLDQELVFDSYTDVGQVEFEESEDSNSESNCRNEYPDSEHSDNSVTYDDMVKAAQKLKIDDGDSDLSSDCSDFAYAVDENDINRYGWKYARFKAKLKEEADEDSDASDHSGLCITEVDDDDDELDKSSDNAME